MTTRRLLVTGGSQGIGEAVVQTARAAGHDVTFTGRDRARVEGLAAQTGAHGLVADVTDADDNARTVDEALARMGGIDVLVNNAGYVLPRGDRRPGPRSRCGRCSNQRLRHGRHHQSGRAAHEGAGLGDIVNIASTSGMKGAPAGTAYSGSKWAVRGITECWRAELRPLNIRVDCICPSEVQTTLRWTGRPRQPEQALRVGHRRDHPGGLALPQRVLWTELAIFATNPWKDA